jgi:hypothetical protein
MKTASKSSFQFLFTRLCIFCRGVKKNRETGTRTRNRETGVPVPVPVWKNQKPGTPVPVPGFWCPVFTRLLGTGLNIYFLFFYF